MESDTSSLNNSTVQTIIIIIVFLIQIVHKLNGVKLLLIILSKQSLLQ